jgi:hypothetical protein
VRRRGESQLNGSPAEDSWLSRLPTSNVRPEWRYFVHQEPSSGWHTAKWSVVPDGNTVRQAVAAYITPRSYSLDHGSLLKPIPGDRANDTARSVHTV